MKPLLASFRLAAAMATAAAQSFEIQPAGGDVVVGEPLAIALGGSEGGSASVLQSAALLASHGFAVLGLPYHSPPGFGPNGPTPPELPALPSAFADIPVDRLDAARAWLAQQPEVDRERTALHGVGTGAEFALIAASRLARRPQDKGRAANPGRVPAARIPVERHAGPNS